MEFGTPKNSAAETPESRANVWQKEALEIVKKLSGRWSELSEKINRNPRLLESNPKLAEIDALTNHRFSGMQEYFIAQIKAIDAGSSNQEDRSHKMQKFKKDLEEIEDNLEKILGQ